MDLFRVWLDNNTSIIREVIPDAVFSMELVEPNILRLTVHSNQHEDIVLTVARAGPWFNVIQADTWDSRRQHPRRVSPAQLDAIAPVLWAAIALQSE